MSRKIGRTAVAAVLALAAMPYASAQSLEGEPQWPQDPKSALFQAGGTSSFTVTNTDTFAQFSDLTLSFNLPSPAMGIIIYKLTATGLLEGRMITRVMVDGVEEPPLRDVSGNTHYYSNAGVFARPLSAGNHTVTVQYRVNCDGCPPTVGAVHNPAADVAHTRKLMVISYTGP